jgi:hypothetical protein
VAGAPARTLPGQQAGSGGAAEGIACGVLLKALPSMIKLKIAGAAAAAVAAAGDSRWV